MIWPGKCDNIGIKVVKSVMETRLRRKIDGVLAEWRSRADRLPLIVKGARQIGKTEAIEHFACANYRHFVEINFILQPEYRDIFADGFEVDRIVKNITLINPGLTLVPGETLLFFDEMQACPSSATSLKSFRLDGRYDVICSGSLMGINYQEIESNSVGHKEDYTMYPLDFEEFLWARGYAAEQIEDYYTHLAAMEPLPKVMLTVLRECFSEYMVLGGMPAVVWSFIRQQSYSGTLAMQRQLLLDYEEDITKYAGGLDKGKILNVYRKIPVFLGRDNKKFQISRVAHGARSREYAGVTDWLFNAGIVNICYLLDSLELPLRGNYNPDNFRIYYGDTGLLVASLDEESQVDLRQNKNLGVYKGALYENIVAQMLVQQGYELYFYRNDRSTLEIDFWVRDAHSLIPLEVKASNGAARSLRRLIEDERYGDIRYGIKLGDTNIGWSDNIFTMPYALTFMLKRFLREKARFRGADSGHLW